MKLTRPGVFLLGLALVFSGRVMAAEDQDKGKKDADKPAAVCPLSGEKIDKSVSVDYEGGKLYFCCKDCIQAFEADKAKYAAKANYQLAVTGQVKQVACPLTGGKVKPGATLKVAGIEVGFCCGGCPTKLGKLEAKEQFETLFGKNFKKTFALKKKGGEDKKRT